MLTGQMKEIYRRYAIEEQDNPEPTDQDLEASFTESVEHYGSEEAAISAMVTWYQFT